MITVCREEWCAGCMACLEICPKDAIQVKDFVRFFNAVIDPERCISCGLCHAVCPMEQTPALNKPLFWKQGWAKDPHIRENSSSGGLAAVIEQDFVARGGVVCSCLFEEGRFVFKAAETKELVQSFAGSKYVKSDPTGIYKEILRFLQNGRELLFVGLPCQSAAVKAFAHDHKNLYTIDLICHGTPSVKLLDQFLHERHTSLAELPNISFRNKEKFALRSGTAYIGPPGVTDAYSMTFLDCVTYTESCYHCPYARQERVSDLTLGDSWGSKMPQDQRKAGLSLILCQSQKGIELLSKSKVNLVDVDSNRAIAYNHQLVHPSPKHPKRTTFFRVYERSGSFSKAAWQCFPWKLFKKQIKSWGIRLLGISRRV